MSQTWPWHWIMLVFHAAPNEYAHVESTKGFKVIEELHHQKLVYITAKVHLLVNLYILGTWAVFNEGSASSGSDTKADEIWTSGGALCDCDILASLGGWLCLSAARHDIALSVTVTFVNVRLVQNWDRLLVVGGWVNIKTVSGCYYKFSHTFCHRYQY